MRAGMRLACVFGVWMLAACGKRSSAATANAPSTLGTDSGLDAADAMAAFVEDPLTTDLWARAADGDEDDVARLEAAVGSDALIEASPVGARRLTALRALAYSEDFTPLPFLAKVATSGTDEEAAAALSSAAFVAKEPRRARDPDDALEAHEGSLLLLTLAKDPARPAARRALAVSVLRLLADRSGVPPAEVPTDLDAR